MVITWLIEGRREKDDKKMKKLRERERTRRERKDRKQGEKRGEKRSTEEHRVHAPAIDETDTEERTHTYT